VKTTPDGGVTHLRDIARIELDASEYGLRSLLDNKPAVAMAIFQSPGANALQISDEVRKTMAELKQDMPAGVDYKIVYDPTQFVRSSIKAVVHTLLEAIALVVLVVIVFLQTWRASIIPLIAVPVSIVGTFALLLAFGFRSTRCRCSGWCSRSASWSTMRSWWSRTSSATSSGMNARQATYKAMQEVSGPIIAIALTLVAVFVPLAFMSGLTGQFYKQFAMTIAISTVISAFNSLTLSPALSAILLKGHGDKEDWLTRVMNRALGGFFRGFNKVFHRGAENYGRGVRGVLSRKTLMLGVYSCWWARPCSCPDRAGRLRARAGQGIPDRVRAAAERRVARPHRE
jgi:multidrug efflux pump